MGCVISYPIKSVMGRKLFGRLCICARNRLTRWKVIWKNKCPTQNKHVNEQITVKRDTLKYELNTVLKNSHQSDYYTINKSCV